MYTAIKRELRKEFNITLTEAFSIADTLKRGF